MSNRPSRIDLLELDIDLRLADLWREAAGTPELSPPEILLAWAFLQPYAEHRADRTIPPEPNGTPPLCPLCGCPPQVGVLRPMGDGGKRSLLTVRRNQTAAGYVGSIVMGVTR